MKLTRKQRAALTRAVEHAERASRYLFRESTAICHVRNCATTTLDFTRQRDERVLCEVEKHYGSDLTGLGESIKMLRAFIAELYS